jgi:hypothetical protein
VDAASKGLSENVIDVVAVGRERHGQPSLARSVLTEPHELGVERRLTAAEADPESAMRIELG